jgi:AraC-like DNA-binding protein
MKPTVRYASLSRFLELGQSLGIDAVGLMRTNGLDPSGLADPDTRASAAAVAQLLEDSAAAAGCDDFGARLAELRQFSNIGPLSLVLREEPDVRSAIGLLIRYEHIYNEAIRLRVSERDELATLTVRFDFGDHDDHTPCRQALELAVGVLSSLFRGFLGPEWQPVSVCFSHGAARDCSVHRRLFGVTPRFDQPFAGLLLYSRDLDATNRMSEPNLHIYAQQFLRSLGAPKDQTTIERVRDLIEVFLPTGRCSLSQVARELHVDRRTLHRHLIVHSETFSGLLDDVRADLAEHYLQNGRYSVAEISALLGFSAASGFSRWFRNHYGCSPTEWRSSVLHEGKRGG